MMKINPIITACLLLLISTVHVSSQTIIPLVDYGQGTKSQGNPSFAYHSNLVYILYTDIESYKGIICRYDLETSKADWSDRLFPTIAPQDASHNGSAIAVDGDGYIHVWIGMHNHPMKYYRSISPGDFNNFTDNIGESMPSFFEAFTYPWACTSTNGDVFVILRDDMPNSQTDERQFFYHWDNANNIWLMEVVKSSKDRNAYMSYLYPDHNNNVHIVTAWSKLHSGDNTYQRGTYLRYDVTHRRFYRADGAQVAVPVDVDGADADLFYAGEKPWHDLTTEIQTPRVTVNKYGEPVVAFPYNVNDYSKDYPVWELNVTQWTGSAWSRVKHVSTGIKNHARPPITYTGDWINTYTGSNRYLLVHSSQDQGHTFSQTHPMLFDGSPSDAQNYDSKTDLLINRQHLFKIIYPRENDPCSLVPNLAVGNVTDWSSQQTRPPHLAIAACDDNVYTYWQTHSVPQWLEIDLRSEEEITGTALIAGHNSVYQFIVEAASDSNDYTLIVDRSDNTQIGTIADPISDRFDPVTARYIKLTLLGPNDQTTETIQIMEFRVFEAEGPDLESLDKRR